MPRNKAERTGTGPILRRAYAEIARRYAALQVDVLAIFDRIPVYALNDVALGKVLFGLTGDQMAAVAEDLQAALDRWITEGREQRYIAWFDTFEADAAQLGAAQSAANLTNLSPAYAATRNLQTIIFSEPYRTRASIARFQSFEHWTGLSTALRTDLSQVIGRAVVDGKNPKAVRTELAEKLGVSKARANLYAQTDITGTLRQARIAEAEHAKTEMGLDIGLLWTSALLPTTRAWHASRNGKVYTAEEVKTFYSVNGNRFRCHCATTECLLDTDGKPILTDKLKDSMKQEREQWEADNDEE